MATNLSKLNRSLMVASIQGDQAFIKQCLDAGAQVNSRNAKGNASLLHVSVAGKLECIKILIAAGADVNQCNNRGESPLISAVKGGHSGCIQELINSGADVNQPDHTGYTPLMYSITFCKPKCTDILLNARADVSKATNLGITPLEFSLYKGLRCIAQRLIEAGADMNRFTCSKAWTVLIYTCFRGDTEGAELLIISGADVNVAAEDGKTALTMATLMGEIKCMKLLLKSGARVNTHKNTNTFLRHILRGIYKPYDPKILWLLKAAGERMGHEIESRMGLRPGKSLRLKNLSREALRDRLVEVDPHGNLFVRIPHLELPSELISYLLYGVQVN